MKSFYDSQGVYMGLQTEGLLSEGSYNRLKKCVLKRTIGVLIEIRFATNNTNETGKVTLMVFYNKVTR